MRAYGGVSEHAAVVGKLACNTPRVAGGDGGGLKKYPPACAQDIPLVTGAPSAHAGGLFLAARGLATGRGQNDHS